MVKRAFGGIGSWRHDSVDEWNDISITDLSRFFDRFVKMEKMTLLTPLTVLTWLAKATGVD
jgi:hypothetical protein